MELQYNELENGIRMVKLIGKLDSVGFNAIDLEFTAHCAGQNARMLIDLSDVTFLASVGIRMFTMNAKSLATRGGKMVLVNPIADVRNVLEMTGVHSVIPMYDGLESAEVVLLA